MAIEWRRICWPDPDATCLHGGCIYCNMHPYRKITTISAWADKAGMVNHRGGQRVDAAVAFREGYNAGFYNADTK